MKKKTLKLVSWNVNGVRAAHKKGLHKWMAKEKPDILCMQEIKAMKEQLTKEILEVDGYQAHWHSAEQKGYSGVGTYSAVEPKAIEMGLGIERFDREGRVLVQKYPEFTLFNVYFPNGKRNEERLEYKMAFYRDFLREMKLYMKRGEKRLIVCGDVNTAHKEIDLSRPKENKDVSGFLPQERAWIDDLLGAGFVDCFREFEKGPEHYTWWDQQSFARERNVGWRIDYFFVTEELKPHLKKAFHRTEVLGSDHCPVGIELAF